MDYQKPVYKSKGVPQKVKAVYQIAIILFTIIGIILVFCRLFQMLLLSRFSLELSTWHLHFCFPKSIFL